MEILEKCTNLARYANEIFNRLLSIESLHSEDGARERVFFVLVYIFLFFIKDVFVEYDHTYKYFTDGFLFKLWFYLLFR